MRQIYSRSFTVTFSTGDSGYVFSERIDPGYILHVISCCAYSSAREASDDVIIGIRNGGQDIVLTAQAPLAAQRGVDTPNNFYVGEGDQVFANFPDCDDTDVLEIHLNGVLTTREDFEKGME
jgi:hypothetical protein